MPGAAAAFASAAGRVFRRPSHEKIAAIMPEMQKLLAPEMTKLGFPPGPMGLMVGFAAFKKASTELEGCAVIQKGARAAAAASPSGWGATGGTRGST